MIKLSPVLLKQGRTRMLLFSVGSARGSASALQSKRFYAEASCSVIEYLLDWILYVILIFMVSSSYSLHVFLLLGPGQHYNVPTSTQYHNRTTNHP